MLALTVASAGPNVELSRLLPILESLGSGWSTSSSGISVTSASTGSACGRSGRPCSTGRPDPRGRCARRAVGGGGRRRSPEPPGHVGRDDVAGRGDPPCLPPLPAPGRSRCAIRLRGRGPRAAPRRRPHRGRAVPGPLRGGEGDPRRCSPSWRRPATRSSASTTTASCGAWSARSRPPSAPTWAAPGGPARHRARLRGGARRPRPVPYRDLRARADGRGRPPPRRAGGPRRASATATGPRTCGPRSST